MAEENIERLLQLAKRMAKRFRHGTSIKVQYTVRKYFFSDISMEYGEGREVGKEPRLAFRVRFKLKC